MPPTVCWMRIACTTQSTSRTSSRVAIRPSASTSGSPSCVSDTTRANSSEMGGSASSHMSWIERRKVWPAESDEPIRVRASGNCA